MSLPLRFGPFWLDAVLASGQSSLLVQARSAAEGMADVPAVVKIPYLFVQRTSGYKAAFLERCQVLAGIDHPSVVPVTDVARAGGLVWCASPDLGGWDGAGLLEATHRDRLRPSARQVLTLGLHLADILDAVHRHGTPSSPLVHGQIRPGKVLFLPNGECRLLLASAVNAAGGERASAGSAERFSWRAPELLLRQPESIRTDVRGLALFLFVVATGSNPFLRTTAARTFTAILQDQVLFEDDATVPTDLSDLLRAAMASDPARRPENMGAFARSLRAVVNRLGGQEDWSPWVATLFAKSPVSPADRSSPDAESLLARISRDAPREGAPVTEPVRRAPAESASGPPSGFTLVPEDLELADPELPEGTVRRPRAAAAVFDAAGGVDSSFVLVIEEDNSASSVVVGTPNGKRESLSDAADQITPQPLPEDDPDEDDDLLPAMSAEEGMAELAREQAEQSDDEDTEGGASIATQPEPSTASVRISATAAVPIPAPAPLVDPTEETEVAEETEEFLDPDETEEAEEETFGEAPFEATVPTEQAAPRPTEQVAPHPPETATAPRIAPRIPATPAAKTWPGSEDEDPPRPTRLPTAASTSAPTIVPPMATLVTEPGTPRPPVAKPPAPVLKALPTLPDALPPPPKKAGTKKPAPPPEGRSWVPMALVVLALVAVGIGVLKLRPPPESPTPPAPVASQPPLAVTAPTPEATQPPAPTPEATQPTPTQPAAPTPPTPTTPTVVGDGATGAHTENTHPRTVDTHPVEADGPPGLISLDPKVSPSRVVLVATFRGPFPKANPSIRPGVGPNGNDQVILTFPNIQSQLKINHRNVASPLVTGVQITSTPAELEIAIDVVPGLSIIPGGSATTATYTFIQPPPPETH